MKKILFLITTISIFASAEMVQRGDGGVFISNEDNAEMMRLLSRDDSDADELDNRELPEMDKIEDSEKFRLIKPVKDHRKKREISSRDGDSFSLPERSGRSHKDSRLSSKGEKRKVRLKNYSNISYDDSMFYYSLRQPTPKKFNKFLEKNHINKTIFKNLVGYGSTIQEAKISALYYDYYKETPSTAENFYKILYKRRGELSLTEKITLADYLLRTGRGDKASAILSKGRCLASFGKNKYNCLYLLGVEKYLKTGKNKNSELRTSKRRIKQAKELYYMKR